MAKIKRTDLKATQIRNRVNFRRRWKSILENENQTTNNATGQTNSSANPNSANQERQRNEKFSSTEHLRRWAIKYNISKRAVSDLLKILIGFGLIWLPKDSRTLLSTPRHIEMENLSNGKIWYINSLIFRHSCFIVTNWLIFIAILMEINLNFSVFSKYNGIEKNIRMIFANLKSNLNLGLFINIDGLPLFESSNYQFWPILARFSGNFYTN